MGHLSQRKHRNSELEELLNTQTSGKRFFQNRFKSFSVEKIQFRKRRQRIFLLFFPSCRSKSFNLLGSKGKCRNRGKRKPEFLDFRNAQD